MRKIRSLLSATSDKEKLSLKVSGNARGPSATNLRARAASLQVNIPRRSRSSTLGTRSSSPRGRDAPPAYPPMRPLSSGSSCSGAVSDIPSHLRWSLASEITLPPDMVVGAAMTAVLNAFEAIELLELSTLTQSAVHHHKLKSSPRKSLAGRKAEATMAQFFTSLEPLIKCNEWSDIFHARMAIVGQPLSRALLDRIHDVCHIVMTRSSELFQASTMQRAAELLEFLNHFKLDVDASIVGVELHPSLQDEMAFPPLVDTTLIDERSSEAALQTSQFNDNTRYLHSTARELQQKIIEMSEMGSAAEAFAELQRLSDVFRREDVFRLERGSLCIGRWSSALDGREYTTFVRVLRWVDQTTMEVHNGRGKVLCRVSHCKPLSAAMVSDLENGRLDKLVLDPVKMLETTLDDMIRSFMLKQLLLLVKDDRAMAVRTESLLHGTFEPDLFDYSYVRKMDSMVAGLNMVGLATEAGLLRRLQEKHSSFVADISLQQFCRRNRSVSIQALLRLGETLDALVGDCFLVLRRDLCRIRDTLENEFERLLDGKRKNEMSTAWLTEVREAVNALLSQRGYRPDAVPHDYISTAPKSMQPIRDNLRILQDLISNADESSALTLISQSLRSKVYPIVDCFVDEAIHVVAQKVGCVLSPSSDPVAQLEVAMKESPPSDKRCVGLLSDVVYLREMRRLEDNPGEHNPHIVPISGLVYSSVVRKEKEMLTVIEVWDK